MNMIFSSLIGISAVSSVRASDHASNLADSDSRVFVLRGITEPAALVPPEQALASGALYMRLPDLQAVGPQHGQIAAKKVSPAGHASSQAGAQGDSNIHSDSRIDSPIGSYGSNQFNSHDAGVKPNHRAALSRSSLNQSERSKPLTFRPTMVSGEVRLPRVQFSRRGPPLELSDDMPSLDFTGKSLKDSGF